MSPISPLGCMIGSSTLIDQEMFHEVCRAYVIRIISAYSMDSISSLLSAFLLFLSPPLKTPRKTAHQADKLLLCKLMKHHSVTSF